YTTLFRSRCTGLIHRWKTWFPALQPCLVLPEDCESCGPPADRLTEGKWDRILGLRYWNYHTEAAVNLGLPFTHGSTLRRRAKKCTGTEDSFLLLSVSMFLK